MCKINSARAYSLLLYQFPVSMLGFLALWLLMPFSCLCSLMWTKFPTKAFLTLWEMREWDICKQCAAVIQLIQKTAVYRLQTKSERWGKKPPKPTTTSLRGELVLVKKGVKDIGIFQSPVKLSNRPFPPRSFWLCQLQFLDGPQEHTSIKPYLWLISDVDPTACVHLGICIYFFLWTDQGKSVTVK